MIITQSEAVPKTANLLACKHWWKVCLMRGDQEKFYRQIYGRAAAQRTAKDDDTKSKAVVGNGMKSILKDTRRVVRAETILGINGNGFDEAM